MGGYGEKVSLARTQMEAALCSPADCTEKLFLPGGVNNSHALLSVYHYALLNQYFRIMGFATRFPEQRQAPAVLRANLIR